MPIVITGQRFPYYKVILDDNPVGYWRLNETSGSTTDDAAASFDGTYNGPTLNQAGLITAGTSVRFDGSGDHVSLPNSGALASFYTDDYTIEAWINLDQIPPGTESPDYDNRYAVVVKEGFHVGLHISNLGEVHYTRWHNNSTATTAVGSTILSPSTTYHVAATVDRTNGEIKVYVNGVEDGSATFTPGLAARSNSASWNIGVGHPGNPTGNFGWPFDGFIDEVAIYNKVLTPTQIQKHYNAGI